MLLIPISDLVAKLRRRGARSVALQFPAGLARQAPGTAAALRREGFDVIVSGDPCYGGCDLALDALQYADVLVHFGHAPVEERSNVIYEPVRFDFDVAVLERALPDLHSRRIGLVTTIQHLHLIGAMVAFLREHGIEAIVAPGDQRTPIPGQVLGCNFAAARATGADEILFVGTGVFHPIGIHLATRSRVVALDPIHRGGAGGGRRPPDPPPRCGDGEGPGCLKFRCHRQHQERAAADGSCPAARRPL